MQRGQLEVAAIRLLVRVRHAILHMLGFLLWRSLIEQALVLEEPFRHLGRRFLGRLIHQ